MNIKTRKITISAILAALTLILGLTPIGYIPIPPVTMTLMCIPVIVGTILEGFTVGLILGFVFGLTSLFQAIGFTLVPNAFGMWLINNFPLKAVLTIFIPRLLIPAVVCLIYKAFSSAQNGAARKIGIGVSAFAGVFDQHRIFPGIFVLAYASGCSRFCPAAWHYAGRAVYRHGTEGGGGRGDGLPEAAVAVVLSIPIVWAVRKTRNKKV